MSHSDSMGGLILTASQEMTLFNDDDVGSMMTLLDNHLVHEQQPQQVQLYNMYEQETYQLIEEQKHVPDQEATIGQNGMIEYPTLSDLSPSLMPIPPAVISNEEYSGPLNFEVFIDPHGSKNPWVFSSMLNKLFITMSNAFPVDFKWDTRVKNLYVRATPLFSLAQHVQEPVVRCIPHSLITDPSNRNVTQDAMAHVIRCQSRNAIYQGNVDKKIHLNVLVPLGTPQTGMETVRLMYIFVCKNSCATGMNRKPFEVVFTLEDETGTVHGRKKINVRVCSCPKRDKEKEEKDSLKNGETAGGPPHGKKRKMDKNDKKPPPEDNNTSVDTKEYLVQFTVLGKQNKQRVLQSAYDIMCGQQIMHGPNVNLHKCINNLREQLKNVD